MSEDVLLEADGFEKALVGVVEQCGGFRALAYDYWKCVDVLVDDNEWDEEEAIEYMDFNVTGAYVGPGTPVFLYPFTPDED
jgi:hypothetical protein